MTSPLCKDLREMTDLRDHFHAALWRSEIIYYLRQRMKKKTGNKKAQWPREMECYSRGLHLVCEERQSRSVWARSLEVRDNVWILTSGIPLSQNLR